jgi:bacterioferritin-associated ferredoxin
MIVCSCNVFSDHELRSTLTKATQRPRMSQIYNNLGGSAQCGRCAHTIKRIMAEMPDRAIGSITASGNWTPNSVHDCKRMVQQAGTCQGSLPNRTRSSLPPGSATGKPSMYTRSGGSSL